MAPTPARAGRSPSGSGATYFGPTQFDIAVAAVLYGGEQEYRMLASSLRAYEQGDPGRLRSLYDSYVGKTGSTYDAEWPAFIAISCAVLGYRFGEPFINMLARWR
jgi:hypothetical protein